MPPPPGPTSPGAQAKMPRLLLALLCSSTIFQGTDSAGKLPPAISSPLRCSPYLGQKFSVWCKGHSAYPNSSIIYWLANGTFVDDLFPDGAVSQVGTREKSKDGGIILQRELTFRAFSETEWHTRFECTILDAAGPVRRAVTWQVKERKKGTKVQPGGC